MNRFRLSFPSGHSSFSAYTMIYLAMYLQLRIKWKGSKLLKHLLQLICLLMAWFTAMTRISNYKHHWSDVLAGSTLGTIVALLVMHCVADLFEEERERHSSTEKHRPTDYETETGVASTQVNNGTANRNCWPNELALRLLTATRPWLSSSYLWEAKVSGFLFGEHHTRSRLDVHVGVAFSSPGFSLVRRILDTFKNILFLIPNSKLSNIVF